VIPDELVLALPRTAIVPPDWQGVRPVELAGFLRLVAREGRYRPRVDLEEDLSWKQLIPYLVLRDGPRVFLMQRTRGGADRRLHDRWTIGIGGHLNPEDGGLEAGLAREWREEIEAGFEPELRLLGLLNDDEDPVGAVHLGVVFEADAGGRPVAVRETDKLRGRFAALQEAAGVATGMESWSRFVLDRLLAAGDAQDAVR
jgi:predicted NUDIX family phosphoesterase